MGAFDDAVKVLWDLGFFTIILPFILVLIISFYFFKWLFEDKFGKSGQVYTLIRYALTGAVSLAVLYISLSTTALGSGFGFAIGLLFLAIFAIFIVMLLGAYFDIDVLKFFVRKGDK
jgi:hypothetical protein